MHLDLYFHECMYIINIMIDDTVFNILKHIHICFVDICYLNVSRY